MQSTLLAVIEVPLSRQPQGHSMLVWTIPLCVRRFKSLFLRHRISEPSKMDCALFLVTIATGSLSTSWLGTPSTRIGDPRTSFSMHSAFGYRHLCLVLRLFGGFSSSSSSGAEIAIRFRFLQPNDPRVQKLDYSRVSSVVEEEFDGGKEEDFLKTTIRKERVSTSTISNPKSPSIRRTISSVMKCSPICGGNLRLDQ